VNLLLLEAEEVHRAGHVTISGARAAHLLKVLRVAPGQMIRLGIVDGPFGTGIVTSIAEDTVTLHCTLEETTPPRPPVDVLLALPRPKVMRRLWAQLAALGVGQIIVTKAERVERNYFDTHVLELPCYRPLLVEGLQQARDTRLPLVSIHRQFKVLVEDDLDALFGLGRRLVAHPGASRRMDDVPPGSRHERTLLAIGPEGGWNDYELSLLRAHGFDVVSTGHRTLRTDTACLALVALAHERYARLVRKELE
jgi:RsmE family RNA methyltransferase